METGVLNPVLVVGLIPEWLPWMLVGAGGGVLAMVVLNALRGPRGRPTPGREAPPRASDGAGTVFELKAMTEAVLLELERKTAELERLVRQADERIAAMRSAEEASGPRRAGPQANEPDAVTREVCRLAGEGATPLQIAQKLGQPVGKVELILALRR